MVSIQYVVIAQMLLLLYHQVTTWFDFFPFNGVRFYGHRERMIEVIVNGVLMSLAPIGFALHIHGLMIFGVIYYFLLFSAEIIIWWVPYLVMPSGNVRAAYNKLLAFVTSNFESKDVLADWAGIYQRIHSKTVTVLSQRPGRIVPNVEHMVLHGWTLLTAIATVASYSSV